MIGSLRWNAVMGIIGMVFTSLLSIGQNTLTTSLIRGLYSFVILFIAVFIIRWFIGIIVGMNNTDINTSYADDEDKYKGGNVDFSTPNEDTNMSENLENELLNHSQTNSQTKSFSPLNPPKLASKDKMDSKKLVEAIRQMSED